MKRKPTLESIDEYEKVNEFLDSMSRNSIQTKKVYTFALSHFQSFLKDSEYKDYNLDTILRGLIGRDIDVYSLLNKFVGSLMTREDSNNNNTKLSCGSISLYVAGVRSYLEYSGIELSSRRFKARVKLPKKYERDDEGIDEKDIRTLLLSCTNATLKAFLLVLASTGMRSNEALSLRNCDLDFDESPTKVHIRAETTKTGRTRDIYISDEASKELKKFIDSKYGKGNSDKFPDHLVFSKEGGAQTISIYKRLREHFTEVLNKVEMNQRKDGQGNQRRQITFHSFRRFVYTTLCSSEGGQAYAEGFIGHSGSTYHRLKQEKKREIYIKSMKYLTFLDYTTLEIRGKNIEAKLDEKDKEVEELRQRLEALEMEREFFSVKSETLEDRTKFYENMQQLQKERQKNQEHLLERLIDEKIRKESPKKKREK